MSKYYELQTVVAQQNLDIYLLEKYISSLEDTNKQLKGHIERFALEESSNISTKKQYIFKRILSFFCFETKITDCKQLLINK